MQLKNIESFIITAKCKSFASAAEKLYISTPALTKQITTLEKELGFSLFNRSNQGISLTKSGEYFYRHVNKIFNQLNNLITESKNLYSNKYKELTIGAYGSDIYVMIPAFISAITQTDLDIKIKSLPLKMNEIDFKLINHEIDLCFLYGYDKNNHNQNSLSYMKIIDDDPLCIVPKQLGFSTYSKISIHDLIGQNLLIVNFGNDAFHDAVRHEITENNYAINVIPVEEGIVDGQLKGRMQPLIFTASKLSLEHSNNYDYIPFSFHNKKISIGILCRKEDESFYQSVLLPIVKETFQIKLKNW